MPPVVTVYGGDHSPWVQGVCLALHTRGLAYRLIPWPVSYAEHAMVMPVCRWADGRITADSFAVCEALDDAPFSGAVSPQDQTRLERLFLSYVLARIAPGKKLAFVSAWAKMPSDSKRPLHGAFRALMLVYFYALIVAARAMSRRRGANPNTLDRLDHELGFWDDRLAESSFFGGETLSALDCAVFGQVQCMATGLTDETFSHLKSFPRLSAWIELMNQEFVEYPHLFSRRLDDLRAMPQRAPFADRAIFYTALLSSALLAPLTLVWLLDALRRRGANPNRSGQRLRSS